jgi:hypothetical protein
MIMVEIRPSLDEDRFEKGPVHPLAKPKVALPVSALFSPQI